MPTYTCYFQRGQVSNKQRLHIVESITQAHHEVANAPRYLVQVVFYEVSGDDHYIAGNTAPTGQTWVRADIRSGRTEEQKKMLLDRINSEISDILGISNELVWVYLCDIPGKNMTEYGHTLRDPGEEDAWFAALPEEIQDKLRAIG